MDNKMAKKDDKKAAGAASGDVTVDMPKGGGANTECADKCYVPNTVSVKAGSSVTWKNSDGAAHTATATDGKSFDTKSVGQVDDTFRSKDVISDRDLGVLFHQRNMLIGRSVENQVWLMFTEDARQRRLIIHIGNCINEFHIFDGLRGEFLFNLEDTKLGLIDQNQFCRVEVKDLSAEF